MIWSGGV